MAQHFELSLWPPSLSSSTSVLFSTPMCVPKKQDPRTLQYILIYDYEYAQNRCSQYAVRAHSLTQTHSQTHSRVASTTPLPCTYLHGESVYMALWLYLDGRQHKRSVPDGTYVPVVYCICSTMKSEVQRIFYLYHI